MLIQKALTTGQLLVARLGSTMIYRRQSYNIVWNVTRACSFCCTFCCVSSRSVTVSSAENVLIARELSTEDKLRVVDQLAAGPFYLDLSGGDILVDPSNLNLIRYASQQLGRSRVSVTIPGAFVNKHTAKVLQNVSAVEVSLDLPPDTPDPQRPLGQNLHAMRAMVTLTRLGVNVEMQTVLRRDNTYITTLKRLYSIAKTIGVRKWSVLRLLPVGRAISCPELYPTRKQMHRALSLLRQFSSDGTPVIHTQYLLDTRRGNTTFCRAALHSAGITENGTVVGCFWARNENGQPLPRFILGHVPTDNIMDILRSPRAQRWRKRAEFCQSCPLTDNAEQTGYSLG
jgi:MoaA/NifB/PqqE/SkfB family radical SAM enzyme